MFPPLCLTCPTRRDAKTLPRFTRVTNPYEVDEIILATRYGAHGSQENEALPSEDWRVSFTRSFKNYRQVGIQFKLRDITDRLQNLKHAMSKPQNDTLVVPLPSFQSREAWWRYITGTMPIDGDKSQEHPSGAEETSTAATIDTHMNGAIAKAIEPSHEPTLSVLKQLSTVSSSSLHVDFPDEPL